MDSSEGNSRRFLLPRLQPEISGHPAVVLIHSSIALPPVVELAHGNAQPRNQSSDADLALLRPAPHEIDHLIPHIVRHPGRGQSSPTVRPCGTAFSITVRILCRLSGRWFACKEVCTAIMPQPMSTPT